MLKKIVLLIIAFYCPYAAAVDLQQVYCDAVASDPVFQEALAQRLADKQNAPLQRAALLPQAAIIGGPSLTRFHSSNNSATPNAMTNSRGYSVTLTLSQTLFNFGQISALRSANAQSQQADATFNAALQDLILRVAQHYFAVLKAQDTLHANKNNYLALEKQYRQMRRQFQVGYKTKTDRDTAKASKDLANASYIAAQTQLINAKEDLRVITGIFYSNFAALNSTIPLVSPQPENREKWVTTALKQNWAIKAAMWQSVSAKNIMQQQFAGHLPSVNLVGSYNAGYNSSISGVAIDNSSGNDSSSSTDVVPSNYPPLKAHTTNAALSLNVDIPLFSGGAVIAQTRQARYQYLAAKQRLEAARRNALNDTRQSFARILSGKQQIIADQQAIQSTRSSLIGFQAGYRIGNQTLMDVLNQQQRLYAAQVQYAKDRYDYIYNLLVLKKAAGTLNVNDLMALNGWLKNRGD